MYGYGHLFLAGAGTDLGGKMFQASYPAKGANQRLLVSGPLFFALFNRR